jgi:hypothetical protein
VDTVNVVFSSDPAYGAVLLLAGRSTTIRVDAAAEPLSRYATIGCGAASIRRSSRARSPEIETPSSRRSMKR